MNLLQERMDAASAIAACAQVRFVRLEDIDDLSADVLLSDTHPYSSEWAAPVELKSWVRVRYPAARLLPLH